MARKKKGGGGGGGGSWLDTYADMVTLLLTFFVMLYAMSSVTEDNWEILIKAFSNPGDETSQIVLTPEAQTGSDMGTNTGSGMNETTVELENLDFSKLYDYLKEYLEQSGAAGSVELSKGENSVFIRFNDAIFFNPDSYELRRDSIEILDFLGEALVHVESEVELVMVAGHTAMVQGYYPVSDWRLSGNRASSVVIYFEEEKAFPKLKLSAIGHGAKYPVDTNDTSDGRKNNRRVEIMILGEDADLNSQEVIDYFLNGMYDPSKYPSSGGTIDVLTNHIDGGDVASIPDVSEPASETETSEPTIDVSSGTVDDPTIDTPVDSGAETSEPTTDVSGTEPVVVPPESSVPAVSEPTQDPAGDLLAPP